MSKLSYMDYMTIENNLMISISSLKQIHEHLLDPTDDHMVDYQLQAQETIELLDEALKRFWKIPTPEEGN